VSLPDYVKPGLKVIFCGVDKADSAQPFYFARPTDMFWDILELIGLARRRLAPDEIDLLFEYGIGLTSIPEKGGEAALRAKIAEFAPDVLAFNGKRAAEAFYGGRARYGLQPERVEGAAVFVLPSTSGTARQRWGEGHWSELGAYVSALESDDSDL
jgi:TDG/mug DNA glycosylase family protein